LPCVVLHWETLPFDSKLYVSFAFSPMTDNLSTRYSLSSFIADASSSSFELEDTNFLILDTCTFIASPPLTDLTR
ncbi:hypothetical protein ADUPG1_005186, partial [Aduncisulcus paluster]